MTGFDRFAHRVLTRLFNYRDIVKPENGKDTLYLRRFYIIRKGPFKLFLHNIRRSDSDRHLHDHPWDFDSICLKNGYIEYYGLGSDGNQATKVRMFSPFNLLRNKAEHTHIVRASITTTSTRNTNRRGPWFTPRRLVESGASGLMVSTLIGAPISAFRWIRRTPRRMYDC
jgi:hypothetical protein